MGPKKPPAASGHDLFRLELVNLIERLEEQALRAACPGSRVHRERQGAHAVRVRGLVEPMIGHMKSDGLLARNWLRGEIGDAIHAVLCGAGYNLRMILAYLRVLLAAFVGWLAAATRFGLTPQLPTLTARN